MATTTTTTIAVIGSLNMDFITLTPRMPSGGETLTATSFSTGFGGKGSNQAVACARLSSNSSGTQPPGPIVHVSMVGAVGSDTFGRDFLAALQREGISTQHVQRVENAGTGTATIIVEEQTGENRILVCAAANHCGLSQVRDLVPPEADVVVFQLEIPVAQVVHNVRGAHERGKYVIFNPAPAQALPEEVYAFVDCLVMNETETDILRGSETALTVEELPRICLEFFSRGVADMVVVTLGGNGVYFATRSHANGELGSSGHVKAQKVKVVDTTAAGDTFVGALAVQMARARARSEGQGHVAVEEMMVFANAASARSVQKAGAMAAIPWLDEVVV